MCARSLRQLLECASPLALWILRVTQGEGTPPSRSAFLPPSKAAEDCRSPKRSRVCMRAKPASAFGVRESSRALDFPLRILRFGFWPNLLLCDSLSLMSAEPLPWPHAPEHRLSEGGTYMVTCGTFRKEHNFRGPERLSVIHRGLLKVARDFRWTLHRLFDFDESLGFDEHRTDKSTIHEVALVFQLFVAFDAGKHLVIYPR